MGKQGGSVEQEEPQVSPDRNVSRLTWSGIMQQVAKETLRFSSQPLPASGQCHGPAIAPIASPGTHSKISWVLRIDIFMTLKRKNTWSKRKSVLGHHVGKPWVWGDSDAGQKGTGDQAWVRLPDATRSLSNQKLLYPQQISVCVSLT